MIYFFTLILSGVHEITPEVADTLFRAGCDDGTPASRNGVAFVDFSREADSLREAVDSASDDLSRAGFRPLWPPTPD
jgi:hypothetical protein